MQSEDESHITISEVMISTANEFAKEVGLITADLSGAFSEWLSDNEDDEEDEITAAPASTPVSDKTSADKIPPAFS